MGTFNKANAGGIGAAITSLIIALLQSLTEWPTEQSVTIGGAGGVIIAWLLTYVVPNKPATP